MPKLLATCHAPNWTNSRTPIFISSTSMPRSQGWDCDQPFLDSASLPGREWRVSLHGGLEFSREQAARLLTPLAASASGRCGPRRYNAGPERTRLVSIPCVFETAGTTGAPLQY